MKSAHLDDASLTDSSLHCPLCGGDASCAVLQANGEAVTDCWCFHVHIPEALLERISLQQRGKSCLCSSCLTRFYAALERGEVD